MEYDALFWSFQVLHAYGTYKFIHKNKKLIFGNTRKYHFRNLLPETPRVLETLAMALDFKTCFPHNWTAQGKQFTHREEVKQKSWSSKFHILPSWYCRQGCCGSWDFHEQQKGQERDKCKTDWLLASLLFPPFGSYQVCRHCPLTSRKWALKGALAVYRIWGTGLWESEEFPLETSSHRDSPLPG